MDLTYFLIFSVYHVSSNLEMPSVIKHIILCTMKKENNTPDYNYRMHPNFRDLKIWTIGCKEIQHFLNCEIKAIGEKNC